MKKKANHEQIQCLQTFHANRWFVLHSIYGIAFLSTITFLLYQISSEKVAVSALILFISAFAVIRAHVERLSELIKDLLEMDAYTQTLSQITEHIEEEEPEDTQVEWNKIELEDIVFSYEDSRGAINIPQFILEKGECICITGESGQGKSTFMNIFAHFLEPETGVCKLDGMDYSSYSQARIQNLMSIVSQEIELFSLSLRENIALNQNLSDAKILEALDGLKLTEWYTNLPQGLDTLVGEKGAKLSAGQKQRINIARGVLLDRPIILFDEPTSHLDDETEWQVVQFLKTQLANRTAIFISHRSTIEPLCNRRYVFKNSVLSEL